jgi:putative DNA primase/helicase
MFDNPDSPFFKHPQPEPTFNPEDDWAMPVPFPVSALTPATFDTVLLPEGIENYAKTIATETQTAIEAIAVATIQITSVIIGTKLCLFAKQRKNWYEFAPIWSVIAARSGTSKTSILREVKSLIAPILQRYEEFNINAEHEYELYCDYLRNQITSLQQAIKRKPNDQTLVQKLTDCQAELRREEEQKFPILRLTTDDPTIEKLQEMLIASFPNTLTVLRDELSGTFAAMLKNGHQNDRDFFLSAYNCTDSYTIDRILRGTRNIKRLSVTLAGFIQPTTLRNIIAEMIARNGYDGFFSRFLLVIFPKRVEYDAADVDVDAAAITEMKTKLDWLEQWHPEDDDNFKSYREIDLNGDMIQGLRFSLPAQALFDEFDKALEDEIYQLDVRSETEGLDENMVFQAMLDHKSKYKTLVLKLCLIFHLLKYAGGSIPSTIDEITILKALAWAEYLESHAAFMYQPKESSNSLKPDKATLNAIALLKRFAEGKIPDGYTAAKIKSCGWSGLNKKEDIENALQLLADYHWISYRSLDDSSHLGGIKSEKVTLNPRAVALLKDPQNYTQLTHQYNHRLGNYLMQLKQLLESLKDNPFNVDDAEA